MKTCPNCGQPALESHRFCMRCGADISGVPAAPPPQTPAQYAAPGQVPAAQQYYAPAPAKSNAKMIWLIVGAVAILPAMAIVLIIAAIAIPNLLRARIAANEASAVGSVRTIVTAEVSYQAAGWSAGAIPVGYSAVLKNLGANGGACATGGAATST